MLRSHISSPRMLTLCTFAAFAVLLAACSGSGQVDDNSDSPLADREDLPLIGLSMDTLQEARWQTDRDLFVAAAEAQGVRVKVLSANSNDTQQLQDVRNLIGAGAKAIVIIPHDGKAMGAAVELAAENKIPVIAYDRLITDTDKLAVYLTFDNVKVGEAQGRYLVESLTAAGKASKEQPAKIVRIYGAPTDNNAKLFKQGQDNIIQPLIASGAIEVVHEDWAENWNPENAKKIANAAIVKRRGVDFDAILASNDGTAGGAVQALEDEGTAGKVIVTGQDAELPALQRIVAGTQHMTVYKPIKVLAEQAATIASQVAKGQVFETDTSIDNGAMQVPSIFSDIFTVTKDNIIDTVIKDGFHPYEEVYRGIPADQRPPKPE